MALPDCAPIPGTGQIFPKDQLERAYACIPSPPRVRHPALHRPTGGPILARAPSEPKGVTIDWIATPTGTLTGTTLFASDTNYFISGAVICSGPAIIESTIFKYRTNASLTFNNTVTCKTLSQFRPAIFTAEDDETVGASCTNLAGYTGVINPNGYANPAIYMGQTSLSLTNFRFCYAQQAVLYKSASTNTAAALTLSHCQFVNCARGIELDYQSSPPPQGPALPTPATIALNVNNSLFTKVQYPIYTSISSGGNPVSATLLHCTVDQSAKLFVTSGSTTCNLNSTNSIYSNLTNSTTSVTLGGNCNGFFSDTQPFGANRFSVSSSPFQSVGAANYYLTDSSGYRNAGTTTGIPSWLQSDLQKRTTYPPVVVAAGTYNSPRTYSPQAQRDTDALDLGVHYDPIDFALGGVLVTNATVTVNPGTVLAMFGTNGGTYGLAIGQNAALQSLATATAPNWVVQYNLIQEQPITNWFRPTNGLITSEFQGLAPSQAINCRFTDWAVPSLDSPAFIAPTNTGPFSFRDCEFHGGSLTSSLPTINLTNCLLERVSTDLEPKDSATTYIRNCLVLGDTFTFAPTNSLVQDNLFDSPVINNRNGYNGGYNAYVTNLSRLQPTKATDLILSSSPSYQAGPLGPYYLLSASSFINYDTITTADQVMLYHYTVMTNLAGGLEIKETNSWVDLSYHYVATDTNGIPIDSSGRGQPDYLQDLNGDGKVESGETDWTSSSDLGLKVLITRPRNGTTIP
jgi:hypothetical protein